MSAESTQEKTYTDSALSELYSNFFNSYKNKSGEYVYVNSILKVFSLNHTVVIDYNDLTDEIKRVIKDYVNYKTHFAIYRAIGDIFASKYGYADRKNFEHNDSIKYQLINVENRPDFKGVTFTNPKNKYWDVDDEGRFAGEEQIDNVTTQLQMDYYFVTHRESDEIWKYDGKIYQGGKKVESVIKEDTEKLIPNCNQHSRLEVISKLKTKTFLNSEFDKDHNLITVENGILDIQTMILKDHTPSYLSRVLIPNEFQEPKIKINNESIFEDIEKNLKGTLFYKFLKSSFTIKGKLQRESLETALEMGASILIKESIDDKSFMNLGSGENGKSVYLNYLKSLMGKNNGVSMSLHDIAEDKYIRAELDGESYNIFTDLEKNELRHTGTIKIISSGESLTVQKKYGHPFQMTPFVKLIFSTNRFPKVYDQTQGFFRRWIIIKWERNFEGTPERNENLLEQLTTNQAEKNLVFSCLVYLARFLKKNGKFSHSQKWKAISKQWNENADPLDGYANNHTQQAKTHKTKREVYQHYKNIMLSIGETPLGMRQFSNSFAEYYEEDRVEFNGRTQRGWLNIDFKEPIQTDLEKFDNNKK